MFTAQRGHRRELLAAAVQPDAGLIVTGEQHAEVVADEGAGRGTVYQCAAQDVEVDPGVPGQEQELGGSDGLTEPHTLTSSLARYPASWPPTWLMCCGPASTSSDGR